ncbi:MAG: IS607 family transposase [Candidatus Hermodarchaeota archaeon]
MQDFTHFGQNWGAIKHIMICSSMIEYMRIGIAAKIMGVCTETIRRWERDGKIACIRTIGGHRRISMVEVTKVLTGKEPDTATKKLAMYARVSSHGQKKKGDLERQIEAAKDYCQEQGEREPLVFTDVASGLKTDRPGLAKLCRQIERGKVKTVVITYQDRLTRFGLDYLERLFQSSRTTLKVLQQPPDQSVQEELVQDLIAIITSFSGRVHGLRSHKNKRAKSKPPSPQSPT